MSKIKLESCSNIILKSIKSPRRSSIPVGRKSFEIVNEPVIEIIKEDNVSDEEPVHPSEILKNRLLKAIDGAEDSAVQIRTPSLKLICDLLVHNYIWEAVEPRKLTLLEIVDNSLRIGKDNELALAVKIVALLQVQLGDDFEYTETLDHLLLEVLLNKSNRYAVRAECCNVLGLIYFMQYEQVKDLVKLMQHLEEIFLNMSKSTLSADASVLHTAALLSYGLLASKMSSTDILQIYKRLCVSMNHIVKLLDSLHLNIRLASGETLAVLTECGTSRNPNIMHDLIPHIFSVSKYLSVNNRRNRHKQKSKSHRATFKHIDQYIENNIQPEIIINYGSESIMLRTWAAYHQYTALCTVIEPGIIVHLTRNDFIRQYMHLNEDIVYPVVKQHARHAKYQAVARRRERQQKNDF